MRVNDIHSQLNPTRVSGIARPASIAEMQQIVRATAAAGASISICGGRHSMGGQQFGTATTLVDMTALNRVLDVDPERGLVTAEAGIDWPRLVTHLLWTGADRPESWGIVQKQTGADRMTVGGALSSNIHGRGLRFRPIVQDVEAFDIIDARGELVHCSRAQNPGLFALAVGGYGLFGPIVRVTLRLSRRHKVQRRVTIGAVEDLPALFDQRIDEGFEYGDFQFATDPQSPHFLRTGVFACYRPVDDRTPIPDGQRHLTIPEWQELLLLAHTNKSRAFSEYSRYYRSTDGQIYWSDTHQMSEYVDDYHDDIDRAVGAPVRGSEMISELYVPRTRLPQFMAAVRDDARRHETNVIYGTVRLIERDDETVLAWAREPWACVVFNLHVDHTPVGIAKAAEDFRRLIDRACDHRGSYYLTYHRWATREQVEACHPRLREVLGLKRQHDPYGVFESDWHRHHSQLLEIEEASCAAVRREEVR